MTESMRAPHKVRKFRRHSDRRFKRYKKGWQHG